jgi:biopolymer transport protein ExbD
MRRWKGGRPVAISTPGGGGGVFWQINITPLTDIFLVLLIIFMITASVSIETASRLSLPVAENTSPEKRGVIVTYTADHEIFVNAKDIPAMELQPVLHDALERISPKVVIFQGDRKVMLSDMIALMRVARAAGAEQIAIAAQRVPAAEFERSFGPLITVQPVSP